MKYAIIGAGIGGLTTALAFERKGIDYQLYERVPEFLEVGAGIWLAPNALQVFEHLGVLDQISANSSEINRITIGHPDMRPISDNPQDNIKQLFGYTSKAIHRAKLQALLLKEIPEHKIHLGKSFQAFEQLSTGKVQVTFEDQSQATADHLIAADGVNSKVRQQLFPASKTRYTGQTCWRGVSAFELPDAIKGRVYELWGDQVRFGFSRIAAGQVYWFAVALDQAGQKDAPGTTQQKLLRMYADFNPLIKQIIQATPQARMMRNDIIDLKPIRQWHQGNICLIGDAGHATTPNMGQGGAQAIEDAYYLSNLIAKAKNPQQNVFADFQKRRQKKVNGIVSQSWTTGKMAHWKYGQGIRNFILSKAPKKLIEQKMIEMYQIDEFV